MAGLNDLADTDTGLVATPEARPRAQPRVRPVSQSQPVPDEIVAAAPVSVPVAEPVATEAAPRKTRAPRKPKPVQADGDNGGGNGQEAAE